MPERMANRMSAYVPERMPDRMSEYYIILYIFHTSILSGGMSETMHQGGDHSK